MITLATITDGLGGVFYGALRPISFLFIAWAAWQAPLLKGNGRRPMMFGALASFTSAMVFLFVNAGIKVTPYFSIAVEYAEIVSTPAIVLFAFGFGMAAIRMAGLKLGRRHDV